ncbi:toxin-antitoxin system antitoxin component Xre family [Peptostreptococcus anaerobius CAG:621]|uniref:helix-turn-helix domain-containing protein n=1 Tax=Peptostreptococcus anaerobius TaxID=1261 RepID=UPI00033E9CCF|nr:helix-turn-helix transcriptional regulator [Peptostreptococcus anaerobius]CCY49966.1 toxin-antitoxin system antitoxin component Xre family [Peptostreptococcus anaerobius CAG:621]
MVLGYKIRKLREYHGISQLELSKKIKISNSVLSRIEQGERSARDYELVVFADFFDVSTDYLLGRTNLRSYPETFTAHTDDDMSDEAKAELESFKDYLRSKYK